MLVIHASHEISMLVVRIALIVSGYCLTFNVAAEGVNASQMKEEASGSSQTPLWLTSVA